MRTDFTAFFFGSFVFQRMRAGQTICFCSDPVQICVQREFVEPTDDCFNRLYWHELSRQCGHRAHEIAPILVQRLDLCFSTCLFVDSCVVHSVRVRYITFRWSISAFFCAPPRVFVRPSVGLRFAREKSTDFVVGWLRNSFRL